MLPAPRCYLLHHAGVDAQRYVEDMKEVTFVQSTKGRDGGILRLLDSLPRADGSLQRVRDGAVFGVAVT